MNPFKYIAEIIAQFSNSQRVIALLLMLLTITVISVTPKLIDSTSHNDSAFSERIEAQKLIIVKLNKETDSLNYIIRKNRLECTNEIVNRETEILEKISLITDMANAPKRKMAMAPPPAPSDGVSMMPLPESNDATDDNQLLNGLMEIRKDIQSSIKNKRGN